MDGRFPFGNPRPNGGNPFAGQLDPQADAQMRAALRLTGVSSMEEALYLQMQAEQRREFELQQMLVRERLAQESRRETIRQQEMKAIGDHLKDFPDLQQQYSRILIGDPNSRGVEDRMILTNRLRAQAEEELRRRQHLLAEHPSQRLVQQQSPVTLSAVASLKLPASSAVGSQRGPTINQSTLRNIAADSLAGNAVRRGEVDRRKFAMPDGDARLPIATFGQKGPRSNTNDNTDLELSPSQQKPSKPKRGRKPKKQPQSPRLPKSSSGKKKEVKSNIPPTALNMLDFASTPSPKKKKRRKSTHDDPTSLLPKLCHLPPRVPSPVTPSTALGTIGDLLDAAHTEDKSDEAATTLVNMKLVEDVHWPESDEEFCEQPKHLDNSFPPDENTIHLPNFVSVLPKFPEEPSIVESTLSTKKKYKGLLDEDSIEGESAVTANRNEKAKSNKTAQNASTVDVFKDLPYLVDKWWPSSQSIKKERQARGQVWMDDETEENTVILGTEHKFRANVEEIKDRVAHQVQPGVLEKIPHCKIHRMLLQRRKSAAPELVYCWQVTELYPNDKMVGCSRCGTWRHAACGGHHKNFSVREITEKPFVPICDRCYEEDKILEDYPLAKKRLDRQRCEQIRRGLSTSAAMRQASFSKHGGTYKWPLGSVSATHIGGHTRSVHTRHDKAEKQWADMTAKLSKGFGKNPKDKIKHRTKELERLLVSVEDAEGQTDRHNMLVFLRNDSRSKIPVGFEDEQRNLFDPADDLDKDDEQDGRAERRVEPSSNRPESCNLKCLQRDCTNKPRFDSLFCSDACGVFVLQNDLLRTFNYCSDMHPSTLRH